MTFNKNDDELIRVILRPVRGCATDSQYCDAYDRLTTTITAIRQEARAAAFKEAIEIVKTQPSTIGDWMTQVDVAANLRRKIVWRLEVAANSVKDSEREDAPKA